MNPLLSGGRGLLILSPLEVHVADPLRRAGLPTDAGSVADFIRIVLGVPLLDRFVGGVLLDAHAGRTALAGPVPWSAPAGLRVGADVSSIPSNLRDATAYLECRLDRLASAGVTFSGWTHLAGGLPPEESSARAQLAASWAKASEAVGLPALLNCTVRAPARATLSPAERLHPCASLSAAEHAHQSAITELFAAFEAWRVDLRNVVLAVNVVAHGSRAQGVAAPDDIAYATARSLVHTGLESLAGLAVGGTDSSPDLLANLHALRQRSLPCRLGFRVDGTTLAPVATAWNGRTDRVDVARRELHSRLANLIALQRDEGGL